MGRPKSRLNSVIDVEIAKLFESVGAADAASIYDILRHRHDEMVQAELQEDARRGLMRRIELRLKQFITESEGNRDQMSFAGLPRNLLERIDETITIPRDDGSCAYLHIRHPNTTVGDVVSHIRMLRDQKDAIGSKITAWREVVQRCGDVDLSTSLVAALTPAASPQSQQLVGRADHHEVRP